jgi:type IV pilus assembly protein PilZ
VKERRTFARKPIHVDVEIVVAPGAPAVKGVCRDLSIGGMYVVTDARVPFGAQVTVLLAVPGTAAAMPVPAVVRWAGPDGLGLQFGLLGAKETHGIAQVLKAQH